MFYKYSINFNFLPKLPMFARKNSQHTLFWKYYLETGLCYKESSCSKGSILTSSTKA